MKNSKINLHKVPRGSNSLPKTYSIYENRTIFSIRKNVFRYKKKRKHFLHISISSESKTMMKEIRFALEFLLSVNPW